MYASQEVFPCETAILCERLSQVRSSMITIILCQWFSSALPLSRINVKLGGVNTVPDPRSVQILTDPHNPTIVMGVRHSDFSPGAVIHGTFPG